MALRPQDAATRELIEQLDPQVIVPGHGPLTVRHRAWRHDGASLVLVVEATCREVTK